MEDEILTPEPQDTAPPKEGETTPVIDNPTAILNALERQKQERKAAQERAAAAQAQIEQMQRQLEEAEQERQKQAQVLEQLAKALDPGSGLPTVPTKADPSNPAAALLQQFQLDKALENQQKQWAAQGESRAREKLQPEIELHKSQAEALNRQMIEMQKQYQLQEAFLSAGGKPGDFTGFYRLCGEQFQYDPESGGFTQVLKPDGSVSLTPDGKPMTVQQALVAIRMGKADDLVATPGLVQAAFEKYNQSSGGGTPAQIRRGAGGVTVKQYPSVIAAQMDNASLTATEIAKRVQDGTIVIAE